MKHMNIQSPKERLAKIRSLIEKSRPPLARMTDQQVIDALRKTREELWEEKVAPHSR